MALADWQLGGGGTYSVLVDGTSPGAATTVISLNGVNQFGNITLSTASNQSVESFIRDINGANTEYGLFLRASNTTPYVSGTSYVMTISGSGGTFSVRIYRNTVNIASNNSLSPLTGTFTGWQKWRFSSYDGGGVAYLRVELYNGSVYVPVLECADGSPVAAGRAGFHNQGGSNTRFDDVKIYSLT